MNYKENIVSPEQVVNLFNNSENLIEDYKMGEIIDNIDSIMANSYFECAIHNFKQTTKKINLFNKAYFFMIIGICGLFIVFLFTVIRWLCQKSIRKLFKDNNRQSQHNNIPQCPTCKSTNIRKIGGIERSASIFTFGLISKKINKTFKCNNCGYTW